MSFEFVVQKALFDLLVGNLSVGSVAVGIYDDIPQPEDAGAAALFPYIVVGDDHVLQWDTDTELGAEITATIHTWSRFAGKKELKDLQGRVYDALHRADFTIDAYAVVLCVWLSSQSFMDTDGLTRHGVQTFKILIEKI
ncbi:MAG: DUF3168 domain-containing protein [Pseudomonadota bacterium]